MQNDNLPEGGGKDFEPVASAGGDKHMPGGNEWGHGHYISDNGFPFVAWVYLLFGGAMLFAVLIFMIKVVANARYRRGNDENFKKITPENCAVCYVDARFRRMCNI